MIDADVIKLKRQDFERRMLAVEAAKCSDPVEGVFTFAELRDEQIRKTIRTWVKGVVGALPGENSVYELNCGWACNHSGAEKCLQACTLTTANQKSG